MILTLNICVCVGDGGEGMHSCAHLLFSHSLCFCPCLSVSFTCSVVWHYTFRKHLIGSLSRVENSDHLTWVRHSSHKSSATHSYQSVWYFRVSKQWHGCQCLGFLTCAQMLMQVIAHGGCSDTERESVLDVDSGRKMFCCARDSNPFQYCTWLFSRTLYQWSYAPTCVIIKACQEKVICSWVHFLLLAQVVHHWPVACCALLCVWWGCLLQVLVQTTTGQVQNW